jgi:Zn-dependent protease
MAIVVFVIIIVSMVLHELAHGVVAYLLGDDTAKSEGRLSLNPLKHLDPVMSVIVPFLLYISGGVVFGGAKPVPINTRNLKGGAWGMALVGIAGPATNFILSLLGFLIGIWTGNLVAENGVVYLANGVVSQIFAEVVMVNLGFMIFNLIPIPPLDGSRVLYAIMPDGVRDFMERIEPIGIVIVMILVMVGATSGIMAGGVEGMIALFCKLVGA